MEVIRSIEELDRKIAECDAAEAVSDDAMRAVFETFRMELRGSTSKDPFSEDYRLAQMELYRQIVGLPYSTDHEATIFDVDSATTQPFPFNTRSTATAGDYFMSIGHVLKTMALPQGVRVLEFGAGWGFTSLWLAQLGHQVTVVDIERRYCDLIHRRGAREGVSIETINADFFWVESCDRQFDAVLFFGCFHHCDDHIRFLAALKKVVAPEGRIFFADEPIVPDFPIPWGLRMDGCSLWGIRKQGWMELGFRDDYFRQALGRSGWFGRKIAVSGLDRLRVWEARHLADAIFRFVTTGSKIQTQSGRRTAEGILLTPGARACGLYGPYVDLPPGTYRARIIFSANDPATGSAHMDIVCDGGKRVLASRQIASMSNSLIEVDLAFDLEQEASGVEVRLFPGPNFAAVATIVEIVVRTASSSDS